MNNTATATKTTWNLDATHSEITFKVRHMMIASVTGKFEQFEASAETEDENLAGAEFSFSAKKSRIADQFIGRD